MMTEQDRLLLAKRILELGLVKKGAVTLRSKRPSDIYYDIKKAYGEPDVFQLFVDGISDLLIPGTTCVAGSGLGGLSLAGAIANKQHIRLSMVRDAPKDHGQPGIIEGYTPTERDVIAIVDDVLTTGGSIRKTFKALQDNGTRNAYAIVIVDRDDSVTLPVAHIELLRPEDFDLAKTLLVP